MSNNINAFQQTYYISRHLRSCNNIIDDKKMSILRKYAEPSLSLWGTMTGLSLDRSIEGDFQNKVYVSCLVRTWFTAIIQYLPHCSENKITLIVSPYIKEKHVKGLKNLDLGNIPVSFSEQIKKLQNYFRFLNIIHKYFKTFHTENDIVNRMQKNLDKIMNNTTIIISFIHNRDFTLRYENEELILVTETEIELNNFHPYSEYKAKENEFQLQKGGNERINTYIYKNLNPFLLQKKTKSKIDNINFEDTNIPLNKIKIDNNKIKKVNIYTHYFGKEGFFLFMDWVVKYAEDKSSSIYVVSHSNIMQDLLVNICQQITNNPKLKKKSLESCNENLSIIRKQNIWELILTVQNNMDTDSLLLVSVGVREGEDPPNEDVIKNIDINEEWSCMKEMPVKAMPQRAFSLWRKDKINNEEKEREIDTNIIQDYEKYVKSNPTFLPPSKVFEHIENIYKTQLSKIADKEKDKLLFLTNFFTKANFPYISNIKDETKITLYNKTPPNLELLLAKMIWYGYSRNIYTSGFISEIKTQLDKDIYRNPIFINGEKFNNQDENRVDKLNIYLMEVSIKQNTFISLDMISLIDIIITQQIIGVINDSLFLRYTMNKPGFMSGGSNLHYNIIITNKKVYIQVIMMMKIFDLDTNVYAYIKIIFQVNLLKRTYILQNVIYTPEYIEKQENEEVQNPSIVWDKDKSQALSNEMIDEKATEKNKTIPALSTLATASAVGLGALFLTGVLGGSKRKMKRKHKDKDKQNTIKHKNCPKYGTIKCSKSGTRRCTKKKFIYE